MVKRGIMKDDAREAYRRACEQQERKAEYTEYKKSRAQIIAELEAEWADVAAEADEERRIAALGPEW